VPSNYVTNKSYQYQVYKTMSAQMDCPICMEVIEVNKNCVTTECGHCFHANCLMKSVAHNGFGCPYCRSAMAEVPDEEETVYTDLSDDEENEQYDDDVLRGLRLFTNNIQGIVHDQEDENDEEEYQAELQGLEEQDETIPTTQFVSDKLREQGISYEQLVSLILNRDHEEYESETLERLDGEIFGKIRIIVSNYTPEQASSAPLPTVQAPIIHSTPVPNPIDFSAQPKISRNISNV
jgi:hypothetical protein